MKILSLPWVGEFGWELFGWQGYLRNLHSQYPKGTKMTVITRPGRGYLYDDFSEVEYFCPPANDGVANGPYFIGFDTNKLYKEIIEKYKLLGYDTFITPSDLSNQIHSMKFITFGEKKTHTYDIIVHARNRLSHRQKDNWSSDQWQKLVEMILTYGCSIACIGHPDEALSFEGCDDLRGQSLKSSSDIVANSDMIVGPSSGPMHFATLCKCPQVVWSDNPAMRKRYKQNWNPHKTNVVFINGNNPSPQMVMDGILKMKQVTNNEL